MVRLARFAVLIGIAVVAALLPAAPAVNAGGSWMTPVQDRYEPGDTATLVGYSGGGSAESGPFHAYLYRQSHPDRPIHPRAIPLYVGELEITKTGQLGYLSTRVAITFELPGTLKPGTYWLEYCNEGCTTLIGDLIAGVFHVGVDPEYPVTREWPASDPEFENLSDDTVISGPGSSATVGEIRARAGDN